LTRETGCERVTIPCVPIAVRDVAAGCPCRGITAGQDTLSSCRQSTGRVVDYGTRFECAGGPRIRWAATSPIGAICSIAATCLRWRRHLPRPTERTVTHDVDDEEGRTRRRLRGRGPGSVR